MPNIVSASMRIRAADIPYGSRKYRLRKFWEWLRADYCYSGPEPEIVIREQIPGTDDYKETPTEHHIGYRCFAADGDVNWFEAQGEEDDICLYLDIECAWSIHSCFTSAPMSYYADHHKEHVDAYGKDPCLTLAQACAELGCYCQIFASEPGMCFAERLDIDEYGNVLVDDETEYFDVFIEDFNTFEDYKSNCEKNGYSVALTKEQFDDAKERGDGFVECCDWLDEDGNWPFTIV